MPALARGATLSRRARMCEIGDVVLRRCLRLGSLGLLVGLLTSACRERKGDGGSAPAPAPAASARPAPSPSSVPEAPPPKVTDENDEKPAETPPAGELSGPTLHERLTTRWRLGELHDVAPAAPMAATDAAIYVVARDDRLLAVPRHGRGFEAIDEPSENFSRFGRGPALTPRYAYWISPRGQLLRAPRATLGLGRPVAEPARSGTRVSAVVAAGRDVVAYLGGEDDHAKAFVWSEGAPPLVASDDASSASSVGLLPGPRHPRLVVLEGRLGMSPVHLRTVRVTQRQIQLAPDEVIWIGPGSEPLTELVALGATSGSASLFLATSRDPSHFGLAHFSLPAEDGPPAAPLWRMYENGLDPAPVFPAHLCGGDHVFYVVPSHAAPRAPQELRVARRLPTGELVEEEILSRARAFNDVSAAPAHGGAVLAWTADRRTWALFVGCPG